ncbi:MAG: hypothetical protein HYV63_08085 [Candidatus Schekmanbacteria bacterium]|nr:hypothetical protein [Candidatus Schekmanbacteria bacterium]
MSSSDAITIIGNGRDNRIAPAEETTRCGAGLGGIYYVRPWAAAVV